MDREARGFVSEINRRPSLGDQAYFRKGKLISIQSDGTCTVLWGGTNNANVRMTIGASPVINAEVLIAIDDGVAYLLDGIGWSTEWIVHPAYVNGWLDWDNTNNPVAYRRVGGVVFLRGLVKLGVINTAVFFLPAGFRPSIEVLLATTCSLGHAEIRVNNVGQVWVGGPNSAAWYSLACSFIAEQ